MLSQLASAHGYTVFDRRGRRVGTFIELAGAGEGIAIRRDRVFLWRRRVLPITTVATVLPEDHAVVLKVDRHTLEDTTATPARVGITPAADEDRPSDEDWHGRIARYVSASERDSDAGKAGADREPPLAAEDPERLRLVSASGGPEDESSGSTETTAQGHLLFVSTSHGYHLVERPGPAPAVFDQVSVPERDGLFRVAKLATSPLPNDQRACAYLEQTE